MKARGVGRRWKERDRERERGGEEREGEERGGKRGGGRERVIPMKMQEEECHLVHRAITRVQHSESLTVLHS